MNFTNLNKDDIVFANEDDDFFDREARPLIYKKLEKVKPFTPPLVDLDLRNKHSVMFYSKNERYVNFFKEC